MIDSLKWGLDTFMDGMENNIAVNNPPSGAAMCRLSGLLYFPYILTCASWCKLKLLFIDFHLAEASFFTVQIGTDVN